MNSRKYWQDREDAALQHYIRDEAEYDRRIRSIYATMLDNTQKEIDAFYARYAESEGITIATAKRRVARADIEAYERKAAQYVQNRTFSKRANEEMRLYNAMMRINRLEMLKANIGMEMIAGHDELEKYLDSILKGRTMDELNRQAGILGKTIQNNAAKANAIVNASFHNATFSDRVWQYQDLLREEVGKLLQSGLISGKNPRALARDLRKTFDTSTFNAERLMRTELARVQTEAQKQSFERNGFAKYLFIVNSGCCPICEAVSKKNTGFAEDGVYLVEDMKPGENAPPMHPHCRCSTAAWEDDAEYEAWLEHMANGGTTEQYDRGERALPKQENSGILKDDKYYPDELAGIERGEPMSWEKADSGNTNPYIGMEHGYSINCQTCVVAFEARLRGYNVAAKPNTEGSMLQRLSRRTNLAWIDPATGKHPEYMNAPRIRTAKGFLPFVQETVEPGKRYTLQFVWTGRRGGHIVNIDRNEAGQLRIKDNQRSPFEKSEWVGDREVLDYLSRMEYGKIGPKVLRVDNMYFDKKVVDQIFEECEPVWEDE